MQEEQLLIGEIAAWQPVQLPVQSQELPPQMYPVVQVVQAVELRQLRQFKGQAMHSRLVPERENPGSHPEQVVVNP